MRINITTPTTWNELSPKQLGNICVALHINHLEVKDLEEGDERNLAANTKMYYYVAKEMIRGNNWLKRFLALKNIPVRHYIPLTKFIFAKRDRTKFIPSVKIKRTVYHAPHFRLKNSTMGEFAFADMVYYQWMETNNEVFLSLLCASLYRPASQNPTDIDIRKPFDKLLAENHADAWQTVPMSVRLAIACTFEGCRNHIVSIYPHIFPKSTPNKNKKWKPRYVPFGELISAKIDYDPSKLATVQNLMVNEFFSIYERELIEISKKPKKR